MTPKELHARLLAGITQQRWGELADLYAENTVVDMPFGNQHIEGRETVRAHFSRAAQGPLQLRARDIVFHETADPEVVIAEWVYDGAITTTGHRFSAANVQVLRVRDGLIVESRDYHDHAALTAALTAATE